MPSLASIAARAAFASMSDPVFKLGDTVSLNSGGHVMTVTATDENSVTCAWSVKDDIKSKSFPAEALKHANPMPLKLEDLLIEALKLKEEAPSVARVLPDPEGMREHT